MTALLWCSCRLTNHSWKHHPLFYKITRLLGNFNCTQKSQKIVILRSMFSSSPVISSKDWNHYHFRAVEFGILFTSSNYVTLNVTIPNQSKLPLMYNIVEKLLFSERLYLPSYRGCWRSLSGGREASGEEQWSFSSNGHVRSQRSCQDVLRKVSSGGQPSGSCRP